MSYDFTIGKLRPWLRGNKSLWTNEAGESLPSDVRAKLTKEQWEQLDGAVTRDFETSCPLAMTLVKAGLVYSGFDGMSRMFLEDAPSALFKEAAASETVTADMLSESAAVKSRLMLPITHYAFVAEGGFGKWLLGACHSARKVGEAVDAALLKSLQDVDNRPLADSIEHARQLLHDRKYFGPYKRIGDFVVQTTPDVIRMVVGLPVTTVHWDDAADEPDWLGAKVMCIVVAQIRTDNDGNVGICRLSTGGREAKSSVRGL